MASAGVALYSESCGLSNSMITEGVTPAPPCPRTCTAYPHNPRSNPPLWTTQWPWGVMPDPDPDEFVHSWRRRPTTPRSCRGTGAHPIPCSWNGRRPRLFLVEEEHRIAMLAAESAFVEGFIGRVADPE